MQAFAEMGVNPFRAELFRRHLEEAHLRAVLFELQYLWDWSQQIGLAAPELALETENPIRKLYPGHFRLLAALQARRNWTDPKVSELETARQFWVQILRKESP
jgi:hypothetical protein